MGYGNVQAVFDAHSNALRDKHTAFRILCYMAHTAQDSATETRAARIYFGGRRALATEALGRDPSEAADQAVKHALAQLRKAGIIQLRSAGRRGRNSEYLLNLAPALHPVDNSPKGVTQSPPIAQRKGVTQSPERGSLSDLKGGHPMTPRQEHKSEEDSPLPPTLESHRPSSPRRRDRRDGKTDFEKVIDCGVPTDLAEAVIATAEADPTTTNPIGRLIKSETYRNECIEAARRQRNTDFEALIATADECPHGEQGGLLHTRSGTPRCAICRSEAKHTRDLLRSPSAPGPTTIERSA